MIAKKRKIIIISVAAICLLFVLPFTISMILYTANFSDRFEVSPVLARDIEEFEGLNAQRYTFDSNYGQQLVGYRYYKDTPDTKGIVIISHGLGGGGHNSYMDVADYFTTRGYMVFAYDATGNTESEGESVKGIPQGVIDLDYALRFVKHNQDFSNLPIMLFGHSWGGYSAGSVLNIHSDIAAVVMVSSFNQSHDIIIEQGERLVGKGINLLSPYISLYEAIKFGRYASYNCIDGFEKTDTGAMIIHSADDTTISLTNSFDVLYDIYSNNPRFNFVKYEDRGHNYVYYSDAARLYRKELNEQFAVYKSSLNEKLTPAMHAAYLDENLDKQFLYEFDEKLMNEIVMFYDAHVN